MLDAIVIIQSKVSKYWRVTEVQQFKRPKLT